MKYLALTTIATLLLSSCISFNDMMVESDYSFNGNFNNYKTFAFQDELNPDLQDLPLHHTLKTSIRERLEVQGYRYSETNPNLYVAYRLFTSDFVFRGYAQPRLEDWMQYSSYEEEKKYDPVKYGLKKGTLIVILRDTELEHTVWQGYSYSMVGNGQFDNDRYLKNAVRNIFDQYRVFAKDFLADARKF